MTLMKASGAISLTDMHKKTKGIVSSRESWTKYKNGATCPSDTSLTLLDRKYPGIAHQWHVGPFDLPFWGVLQKDSVACDAYLRSFLRGCRLPESSVLADKPIGMASLSDCLLGLLQQILAGAFWRVPKEHNIQPVIDELYSYRRQIRSRVDLVNDDEVVFKPILASNPHDPVLEQIAQFYYENGLNPPWDEGSEEQNVEHRDIHVLQPEAILPFDMSESDFLALFIENPEFDSNIEDDYEFSVSKCLKNVPVAVRSLASALVHARLSANERYNTFKLEDLVQIKPNPLRLYCQRHFVLSLKKPQRFDLKQVKCYNGLDSDTPFLFRYDTLLAIIAAMFLARSSKSETDQHVADFLWDGLEIAFLRQFNQDLYDAVKP